MVSFLRAKHQRRSGANAVWRKQARAHRGGGSSSSHREHARASSSPSRENIPTVWSQRVHLRRGVCEDFGYLSTTTVVMEAHESLDERLAGAHVVDNGFDVPTAASFFETATRPAAPQANGLARAAQSPTSGAPRAPSTPQTHPLGRFFPLLLQLDAGQPVMDHHA